MTHVEFDLLLKRVSRSFHLSLRILPPTVRPALSLAYALARASDTIADSTTVAADQRVGALRALPDTPPTTRIHVPDPAEQELLDHLPGLLEMLARSPDRDAILHVWDLIREGQAFDASRFPSPHPLSHEELDRYIYLVAGCVGEFWTRLCFDHVPHFSPIPPQTMLALGRRFGDGLQLVNILRDRAADAALGRTYIPPEQFTTAIARARNGMKAGLNYAAGIRPRRLRAAVALPALLGQDTLDLIARSPEAPRVRVSRWRVRATFLAAFLTPFRPDVVRGA